MARVGLQRHGGGGINNTNDETEETKARILVANKAYSHLQTYLELNKSAEIIKQV